MPPASDQKKRRRERCKEAVKLSHKVRQERKDAAVAHEEIKKNIEKLKRKQGQFITKEEARCIIYCYFTLLKQGGLKHNGALGQTAKYLGVAKNSVSKAVASWNEHGEIRVASRSGPTGGRLTAGVKKQLVWCMEQLNREGDVTLAKLQAMLRTPPSAPAGAAVSGDTGEGAGEPISVSISTIHNWLKILGYARVEGQTGVTFAAQEAMK